MKEIVVIQKRRFKFMDMLERKDLSMLIEERDLCVSIFLPTHRKAAEIQQDPIRLSNALSEAEKKLQELGMRAPEAKALLDPARRLVDYPFFWRHQSDGLAIFVSPNVFRCYRLPRQFDELLVVTRRFHIKPLLSLFAADGLFYILALSKKQVRLLQASRYNVMPIDVEDMPKGLADVLKYDVYEQNLQFHTQTSTYAMPGKRAAVYHGQGGGTDNTKDNIFRYFKQVDNGLQDVLKEEKAPLVLSGVDYLIPIYLKANTYAHTLDKGIPGNPDELSDSELHIRAWEIVEPLFLKSQRQDFSQYLNLSAGPRTSGAIRDILIASYEGRTEILFVAQGMNRWGSFSLDRREITLSKENETGMEDLLDLAAVQTILHGGTVHIMKPDEMGDHGPIAAVFRYKPF
ncbi:MAG: hypothetical protein ABRQ32_07140 [Smithellaceae bacterium]